jgi:hypothetical protein
MKQYTAYQFDNRDAAQMYEYMEARIEALKRRILQLEAENESLRWQVFADTDAERFAASA